MMKRVMFLLFFFCVLFLRTNSQIQTIIDYSATIASRTPLSLAVVRGAAFENLTPGLTYETIAIAEGTSFSNINHFNGNETFSPAQIEIEGTPNSQIIVHFILPHRLYSQVGDNGFVHMEYDHQSASIFYPANGHYYFFNPEFGVSLSIPGDGNPALIYLGGNPQITPFTETGEFMGFGIVTIEYS